MCGNALPCASDVSVYLVGKMPDVSIFSRLVCFHKPNRASGKVMILT